MDFVINGDPENPNPHPMDASMVTRFIKEFQLEKEALAAQQQVNQVCYTSSNVCLMLMKWSLKYTICHEGSIA